MPRERAPLASPWLSIAQACAALALASLLFNVTLDAELHGRLKEYSYVRKSITKVLSSGTMWAAIAFYAGWRVARPLLSFVAGVGAAMVTLSIHYVLGSLLGVYPPDELASNGFWYVVALVLCGPMGLLGWVAATQAGALGVLATLVVPAGAIMEPFVLGRFGPMWPGVPWPERYSDYTSGVVLVVLGVVGAVWVVRNSLKERRSVTSARVG